MIPSLEQSMARILDMNAKKIEDRIIDSIVSNKDSLSPKDWEEYCVSKMNEIIALRKLSYEIKASVLNSDKG